MLKTATALRLDPTQDPTVYPEGDPTVYPSKNNVGEGSLQRFICDELRPNLERYLNRRAESTFVGANQFIYYKQFDPMRNVAPDLYVLPGVRPGIKIDSWKIWKRGITPSFALEIVSKHYEKDYLDVLPKYDEVGVQELIVFDPEHADAPSDRLKWQVYRRLPRRALRRVEGSNSDRVHARVLGCWLRAVGQDLDHLRLRIATGPRGDTLVPTPEEEERAAREAEQAALKAEQAARAELEAERALREKLAAELERLRADRVRPAPKRRPGSMKSMKKTPAARR